LKFFRKSLLIAVALQVVLTSCGGSSSSNSSADSTLPLATRLDSIKLPNFDLSGFTIDPDGPNFTGVIEDNILGKMVSYTSDGKTEIRQCLGGKDPVSFSIEDSVLADGWKLKSLYRPPADEEGSSTWSIEIFQKADFLLTIHCAIDTEKIERMIYGFWGERFAYSECIISVSISTYLTGNKVFPRYKNKGMYSGSWTSNPLSEDDFIFVDSAIRLEERRPKEIDTLILDEDGDPYPYRDEYPRTPEETKFGPAPSCQN
jgi:hypothetical protein